MMHLHHECVKTSSNMEYASALLMTPISVKATVQVSLLGSKYFFKENLVQFLVHLICNALPLTGVFYFCCCMCSIIDQLPMMVLICVS
jgi:hypothetical protein